MKLGNERKKMKNNPVENALYFLLRDALEYARLKTFGGYLTEHGGLTKISPGEIDDHLESAERKVLRSAVSYLHSTTVEENYHARTTVMSWATDPSIAYEIEEGFEKLGFETDNIIPLLWLTWKQWWEIYEKAVGVSDSEEMARFMAAKRSKKRDKEK